MPGHNKKRILVTIVGLGSVIHLIRTGLVSKMREFCIPVIAITWNQPDLINELKDKGYEVYIIPEYRVNPAYTALRNTITFWYQKYILKSPSTKLKKKLYNQYLPFKKSVKQKIKNTFLVAKFFLFPAYSNRLKKQESIAVLEQPSFPEYTEWVNALNLDGIFTVTPFYEPIECLARIIKAAGKPILASIHSFDNITKRGWPAFYFDKYIVWNEYNKKELIRINPLLALNDRIVISGAPQFDFHYSNEFFYSEEEWLLKKGITGGKKIVLYAGGPVGIFPNEPQYLKHLAEAIDNNIIKDAVVLFRCHPLDKIERWKNFVGKYPFLFYDNTT